MSQIIGADTAQLRGSVQQMEEHASTMTERALLLRQVMDELGSVWSGAARDQAMARWGETWTQLQGRWEDLAIIAAKLRVFAERIEEAGARFGDATSTPAAAGGTSIRRPAQSSEVYRVPGRVPHLKQSDEASCWAAVAAMLRSWRDERSYDEVAIISGAGAVYQQIYEQGIGLAPAEEPSFFQDVGLTAEPGASHTPASLLQLLRAHGPLAIGTAERAGAHYRVLVGMSGDGTPAGTHLAFLDPATGRQQVEPFSDFARKYARLGAASNQFEAPHLQIIHN